MIIGCPAEIKIREHRIALIPACVKMLKALGHTVLVEKDGGLQCGISNDEYVHAGAQLINSAKEIWNAADLIVKVKEPLASEYNLMRPGQTIFTFLHLAAEPELTEALLRNGVTGVAFETIQVGRSLPILKPMSEVAGRMAVQVGAWCLEKQQGGRGLLLGGVPGVPCGEITIIGGGVVGSNAAKMGIGSGAHVTILDTDHDRLAYLDDVFCGRAQTLYSTAHNIEQSVLKADLVVGAVLNAGARAPKLITRDLVGRMKEGSVIVDVAVDQGGCVETIHATTHEKPIFIIDGVVHYGVSNMPGAVAHTSTFALAHATMPYIKKIAELGIKQACLQDPSLAMGLNTFDGKVMHKAVADALGYTAVGIREIW